MTAWIRKCVTFAAFLLAMAAFGWPTNVAADETQLPLFLQTNRNMAIDRTQKFIEAPSKESAAGVTRLNLSVQYVESSLDLLRVSHLSYNGKLVGPTIRVRPGYRLEIRLENNLPRELAPRFHDVNAPHELYSTNLHTHGLHVSPNGEGDNMFLQVNPGEAFTYKFDIPSNHPAGTFWYHAHKHGSVAYQLANGMAGALIVDGGLDDARELDGVEERIMLFQQFRYRIMPGRPAMVYFEDIYSDYAPSPDSHPVTVINGVVTPVIAMRPRQLQRWRMIHAGIDATINLNLEGHQFQEVAVDGLATGKMTTKDVIELQPGYRSDVLVQASDKQGKYLLKTEVTNASRAVKGRTVPETFVAVVEVSGEPKANEVPLPPPESLARFRAFEPILDTEVKGPIREVKLMAADGKFLINGQPFSPDRVDQRIPLGAVEEWKITAELERHPMHLHTNPFEVITRDGNGNIIERVWRDTVFVPAGRSISFRSRFIDFTGRTVLHCHNLDHEDQGMMQVMEIYDPSKVTIIPAAQSPVRSAGPTAAAARGNVVRAAPEWSLRDSFGRQHQLSDYKNERLLLVLHRGLGCPHCAEQIVRFGQWEQQIRAAGFAIVAVSPDEIEPDVIKEYHDRFNVRFPLLADPHLAVFREYRCLAGDNVLHGTFLIDTAGSVRWQSIGEQPEMDVQAIIKLAQAIREQHP